MKSDEQKHHNEERVPLPPSRQDGLIVDEQLKQVISQVEYEQLLEHAQQLLQEKQWLMAAEIFAQLVESDEENNEDEAAYLGLASAQDALNQFAELEITARHLLERNPGSAPALAFKARALQKLQRLSEATIANDQALLLDTNLPLAWINRCGLHLLQQKFPEALRSSQRAIEVAPTDARAWANRGVALLNFDRLTEALDAFERSLQYDPASFFAMQMKGEILCKMGRMRDVIPNARRALTLNPGDVSILTQAIVALRSLEQYDALQDVAQELMKIVPDSLFAWEHYMRGLRGLGRFEEANNALDYLLELDPTNVRFMTMKADTLYRLERYREAASIAARALKLDRDYAPAQRLHEKAVKLMYQRKK